MSRDFPQVNRSERALSMQSGSESARISHGFVRTAFGSRLRSERFQQSREMLH